MLRNENIGEIVLEKSNENVCSVLKNKFEG